MRRAASTLSMLAVFGLLGGSVAAQSYPNQPVKLVVPFAPGGSVDVLSRILADQLSRRWGQPVVIENRPGAAGNLAAEFVARSKPDGHTLLVAAAAFAVNATLYKNLRFDPRRDFVPAAMIGATQNVLVVNPAVPARNVSELIVLAKARPGAINYSSTGVGTSGHLTIELFRTMARIDLVHVPYRAIGQSMTDLMSGVVSLAMPTIPGALGNIAAGKLRPLAVSGKSRSPTLPDVPTMAESGLSGYEATTWYAILAPAGVPQDVIIILNAYVAQVLGDPEMKVQLDRHGIEPRVMSPKDLARYIDGEIDKWADVIKVANIKVE